MGAETHPARLGNRLDHVASMRPRHDGRGNAETMAFVVSQLA